MGVALFWPLQGEEGDAPGAAVHTGLPPVELWAGETWGFAPGQGSAGLPPEEAKGKSGGNGNGGVVRLVPDARLRGVARLGALGMSNLRENRFHVAERRTAVSYAR